MITTIGVAFILINIVLLGVGPRPSGSRGLHADLAVGDRPGRDHARARSALRHRTRPDAGAELSREEDGARQGHARDRPGRGRREDDGGRRRPRRRPHVLPRLGAGGGGSLFFGLYYGFTGSTSATRPASAPSPRPCSAGSATSRARWWAVCHRADPVPRRPAPRGPVDRRHHLLDPGDGAGFRPAGLLGRAAPTKS